jgi:hypothetical protein
MTVAGSESKGPACCSFSIGWRTSRSPGVTGVGEAAPLLRPPRARKKTRARVGRREVTSSTVSPWERRLGPLSFIHPDLETGHARSRRDVQPNARGPRQRGCGSTAADGSRDTRVVAGCHLLDPNTRKAVSIVVVEKQEAGRAVQAALAARPADARVGIDPDHVEFFEATSFRTFAPRGQARMRSSAARYPNDRPVQRATSSPPPPVSALTNIPDESLTSTRISTDKPSGCRSSVE